MPAEGELGLFGLKSTWGHEDVFWSACALCGPRGGEMVQKVGSQEEVGMHSS